MRDSLAIRFLRGTLTWTTSEKTCGLFHSWRRRSSSGSISPHCDCRIESRQQAQRPRALERRRPRHSHPERSQGGVREAEVVENAPFARAQTPEKAGSTFAVAVQQPLHSLT